MALPRTEIEPFQDYLSPASCFSWAACAALELKSSPLPVVWIFGGIVRPLVHPGTVAADAGERQRQQQEQQQQQRWLQLQVAVFFAKKHTFVVLPPLPGTE